MAIARAFAAKPDLVICDEITAPLDVSVQASVVELLLRLREANGTAYLFITHDLNLVQQVAHRIAVMKEGEIVDLLDIEDAALRQDASLHTRADRGFAGAGWLNGDKRSCRPRTSSPSSTRASASNS